MLEGVYAGIDDGWFQGEIADAAYEFERQAQRGASGCIVGVNAFTEGNDDDALDILRITAEQEQQQVKRLRAVKADRDARRGARPRWPGSRADAADPDVNLMPALHRRGAHLRHRGRDHGDAGRRVRSLRRDARHLSWACKDAHHVDAVVPLVWK